MADAEVVYCPHCGVGGASCTNTCTCPNIEANQKVPDVVLDIDKVTLSNHAHSPADFH